MERFEISYSIFLSCRPLCWHKGLLYPNGCAHSVLQCLAVPGAVNNQSAVGLFHSITVLRKKEFFNKIIVIMFDNVAKTFIMFSYVRRS